MAEPIAWRVIERGWSVLDSTGDEVGKVDAIVGDVDADIFNGVAFGDGGTVLTRARYVAAEHVAEIREGVVALDLPPGEVSKLGPYHEPVFEPLTALEPKAEEARDNKLTWSQRLANKLLGRRP